MCCQKKAANGQKKDATLPPTVKIKIHRSTQPHQRMSRSKKRSMVRKKLSTVKKKKVPRLKDQELRALGLAFGKTHTSILGSRTNQHLSVFYGRAYAGMRCCGFRSTADFLRVGLQVNCGNDLEPKRRNAMDRNYSYITVIKAWPHVVTPQSVGDL